MNEHIPSDGVVVRNARFAVSQDLEKKRALNQPIARFDVKTKKVYLENSDGTTQDVGFAMTKGRYSERRK